MYIHDIYIYIICSYYHPKRQKHHLSLSWQDMTFLSLRGLL